MSVDATLRHRQMHTSQSCLIAAHQLAPTGGVKACRYVITGIAQTEADRAGGDISVITAVIDERNRRDHLETCLAPNGRGGGIVAIQHERPASPCGERRAS